MYRLFGLGLFFWGSLEQFNIGGYLKLNLVNIGVYLFLIFKYME